MGPQGFDPLSTGFSHAGSDPRVFSEPWVSAPVCHHRNSANPFAIKPMTGARNSTRLNYVPMGLWVAQERRGYLTLRRGSSGPRTARSRRGPEFLRECKCKNALDDFQSESHRAECVLLANEREDDDPGGDVQSDQSERRQQPRPNDRPRGAQDREAADELQGREDKEERHDDRLHVFPNGDDVNRTVRKEKERRKDSTAVDLVPQDGWMVDCVSEKQQAEAPRNRGQTNEVRRAEVAWRTESARQDDLGFERPRHEEDPESRQDEGEAGSEPLPAHATTYHAESPSTFAVIDRSPLPHLLFALAAAHPLLAPLPAHLSALLPGPRRAFHRVAGARVASFPISSFPSRADEFESVTGGNLDCFRSAHEVAYQMLPGPW